MSEVWLGFVVADVETAITPLANVITVVKVWPGLLVAGLMEITWAEIDEPIRRNKEKYRMRAMT